MERKTFVLIHSVSLILVVLTSLCIGGVIFYLTGIDPLEAFKLISYGAIGSKHSISESIVVSIPLMLAGLGVAFAFKCGIWNVGAEGQLYMGAIGASFGALYLGGPGPLHLLLVVVFSFLAGGAWAAIAGILKAKLKINEILTTLMMNYVAIWIAHYLVYGPWRDLRAINPQTSFFPRSAWLPILIPGTRLHAGLLVGLVCAILTYVVFKYTKLGFAIKFIGANPKAAHYGGINVPRTVITTMFISGGLAGLAGMGEVSGIHHYLRDGIYPISPGYGYIAIGGALLGGLSALGTVVASLFLGSLLNGASFLKTMFGLHSQSVQFLVGILVLGVICREIVNRKIEKHTILKGKD
jgi:simple sugar transport system permease protein